MTARVTTDGLVLDFSHDDVVLLEEAADLQIAALALITASLANLGQTIGEIVAFAAAAIAATLAADKVEFQANDKGNGVEVTFPWFTSIVLGWWGLMLMKPLPAGPRSCSMDWPSIGGYEVQACPVVGINQDGREEVFVLGGNSGLYHNWQLPGGGWSGWAPLGAVPKAPGQDKGVGVAIDGSGSLYAFRSLANGIWYSSKVIRNGGWGNVTPLPPGYRSSFAVASNKNGQLEVAALNGGELFYSLQFPNGKFSDWASLGGTALQDGVVLGANQDGRLEVFVVGGNGVPYHRWQTQPNGLEWAPWDGLGDASLPAISAVTLASRPNGSLVLFLMRQDRQLSYRAQTGPNGGWGPAVHLGGTDLQWPCAAGCHRDGTLEVFVVGGDGRMYSRRQTNLSTPDAWNGWIPLGGCRIQPGIGIGHTPAGDLSLYVVSDGSVYRFLST
jgi:hypothetical protein